jgi:hypothetical protein
MSIVGVDENLQVTNRQELVAISPLSLVSPG